MGDKTISVRVRFEGGDQVKAGLTEVGREGSRAIANIGTVSRNTGAQLQNAGYQVSDFFVQVAGGTAPSRALAQQLPQLLQGFGLIGVAASVAIAALPSLWALFSSGEADAESLTKELEAVARAVDAASNAADLAAEPLDKLIEKYGDLADEVKRARIEQAEIASGDAKKALSGLLGQSGFNVENSQGLKALAASREDFRAPSEETRRLIDLAGDAQFAVSEIAREYKLTTDQALNLALATDQVRASASQGAAEQVAAAQNLKNALIEIYGSAQEANEATNGMVTSLNGAIEAAANVASVTGTIEEALISASGVDLSGVFSGAFGAADTLLGKVGSIIGAVNQAVAGFARAQSARDWIASNSSGGAANLAAQYAQYGAGRAAFDAAAREKATLYTVPSSGSGSRGGGGGGGGGGGVDKDLARAAALTEAVRSETEKYAIALEEINRLKEKGLITDETYNRQLDKLKENLGDVGDIGKDVAAAVKSAFSNVFDDPQAAPEDLAKQLAMMALFKQILPTALPGLFGAGGFLSGMIPGFAAGGYHRGGLRIVGENGPELEATGPSMIYPADALRSMGRGGGGGMRVQVINNTGQPAKTETRRGPSGEEMVRVLVGEEIARGGLDKPMRGRFGAAPQRIKR